MFFRKAEFRHKWLQVSIWIQRWWPKLRRLVLKSLTVKLLNEFFESGLEWVSWRFFFKILLMTMILQCKKQMLMNARSVLLVSAMVVAARTLGVDITVSAVVTKYTWRTKILASVSMPAFPNWKLWNEDIGMNDHPWTWSLLLTIQFRKKWIESWIFPRLSGAGGGCWRGISRLHVLQI